MGSIQGVYNSSVGKVLEMACVGAHGVLLTSDMIRPLSLLACLVSLLGRSLERWLCVCPKIAESQLYI